MFSLALVALASFLLGSLVAGVLYSRFLGADIRDRDLPGASGTYRQHGLAAALGVTAFDMSKAVAAVLLARALTPDFTWVATLFVILGHCYPAFFRFRGGGGIAPLMGALLVTGPLTLAGMLAFGLAIMGPYKAKWQRRVGLNAVPFATALAVPVGVLIAARYGGLPDLLAGGAAMAVRAVHLLARPGRPAA